MKRQLAVFTGPPEAMAEWRALPEAERRTRAQGGLATGHAWAEKSRTSLEELGGPLGRTKRITSADISDMRNKVAAFAAVPAQSR